MLIEITFLATGAHSSCTLYEWFLACQEPWREGISLNCALLFSTCCSRFFSLFWNGLMSSQASCKTFENTEFMQVCVASVWARNGVGMRNEAGQYFILHVYRWLSCGSFVWCVEIMLLEEKLSVCANLTRFHLTVFSGCVFFLCLGIFYMFRPNMSFVAPVQEKVVVGLFFLGAILCLSFSWLFHTVYCHSEGVSRLFSK